MKKILALLIALMILAIPAAMANASANPDDGKDFVYAENNFLVYKNAVVLAGPEAEVPAVEVPAAGMISTVALASVLFTLGCAIVKK